MGGVTDELIQWRLIGRDIIELRCNWLEFPHEANCTCKADDNGGIHARTRTQNERR